MVTHLLLNLLLTFVWVALTGELTYGNFFFGYILGFFILWLKDKNLHSSKRKYFTRVPKIIEFIFSFIIESIRANLQVAFDVITPRYNAKPGIVGFRMKAENNFEITMFANAIALTPGTLVLEVDDKNRMIYIHVMYLTDKEKFIQKLENGLEKKLLEILR